MVLKIKLDAALEKRLKEEAARSGQAPEEFVRCALEERLAAMEPDAVGHVTSMDADTEEDESGTDPYAGLPRRDPKELIELARKQGKKPLTADDLRASFWPEDEDIDEFIATIRSLRGHPREAKPIPEGQPFAGMPRRSRAELHELALKQVVKPIERFEDLLGDFWPEDESVEEFLEARRRGWRDDGPASTEELPAKPHTEALTS
jgi:hypothetical protein